MGVKRETWSRYESGKLRPGMGVLSKFAECGADIAYILAGSRADDEAADSDRSAEAWVGVHLYAEQRMEKFNREVREDDGPIPPEEELLRLYREATEEGMLAILNTARAVRKKKGE